MRIAACIMGCLALAACNAEVSDAAQVTGPKKPSLAASPSADTPAQTDASATAAASHFLLDGDGLRDIDPATGATPLVPFGTRRAMVDRLVGAALGAKATSSSSDECGAGAMEFSAYGPLMLNFQDGKFVGWYLAGSPASDIQTMVGISVGSARETVDRLITPQMIDGSTLGEEFYSEEFATGGFYENGKVASLYAGTNCFFR